MITYYHHLTQVRVASVLLESGAEANATNKIGQTALIYAASQTKKHHNQDFKFVHLFSCLWHSVRVTTLTTTSYGHHLMLSATIDHCCHCNHQPSCCNHQPTSSCQVIEQHRSMINLLLEKGADVNLGNSLHWGWAPIHWAALRFYPHFKLSGFTKWFSGHCCLVNIQRSTYLCNTCEHETV